MSGLLIEEEEEEERKESSNSSRRKNINISNSDSNKSRTCKGVRLEDGTPVFAKAADNNRDVYEACFTWGAARKCSTPGGYLRTSRNEQTI